MNAAFMMMNKLLNYMSCIKNLGNPDPTKWIPAGCPLPAMIDFERKRARISQSSPKLSFELYGAMFKSKISLIMSIF